MVSDVAKVLKVLHSLPIYGNSGSFVFKRHIRYSVPVKALL